VPIGPGTKLGPYVVQESIGQGAMGVVYRAYHAQLERECAVKVLQALGTDSDATARFRREAQSIARMRHPNVLNVFDFGEYEGTPYMIVEYIPGGSLAPRVKNGPLDRGAALAYLRGIGDALDYAHKHGIVHRDVKPANVLLGPEDNPILADFGLAKLMESSSIKSLTGVTTGTPAYMAPEQVAGSQVGPASDRYSLAVMAYEMLTGTLPFEEGGVLEVLYAQVHKQPAVPSMIDHSLPPAVDSVILRGMAKDPAARWERCKDFIGALEIALSPAATAAEKTIAFTPPAPQAPKPAPVPRRARAAADLTAVMAADAAAGPIRGPDPTLPHPVIAWGGFAVPGLAKPRRSRRRIAVVLGVVVLILLVVAAAAAYLLSPPSLTLSSFAVKPGDPLTVSADHLPPYQQADIVLSPYLFPLLADAFGNATRQIEVPSDIDAGDHTLKICWGQSCPLSTTLHVQATSSLATPSPSPLVSASASPAISVSPTAGIVPGRTQITVIGSNFTPDKTAVIYVVERGNPTPVSSATTGPTGSFSRTFMLPAKTSPGAAAITACDAVSHCGSALISIA